ncbi:MAG: iron-sulfur cluster repair di-iron protein [Parvibaculum sp.]|uniref:iron-sulfur cluster repair di-iron protein n=1 Tax=Parvibaculum sp. TaxID=2024848 RepID=UPI003C73EAEA
MSTQISTTPLRNRTVGEIAATMPGATAIFRSFKVDFCCHGEVALGEAARERGIDVAELEKALLALDVSEGTKPAPRETGELIDHILTRYHETLRRELPELIAMADKVEAVHARHPQVPHGMADILRQMLGEVEVHMKKEELILFPAMRKRAAGGLDTPIAQLRHEHVDHGAQLEQLEHMTGAFTLPEGACRTWQALYVGSAKLADDLIQHIHLENNILFPRYEEASRS